MLWPKIPGQDCTLIWIETKHWWTGIAWNQLKGILLTIVSTEIESKLLTNTSHITGVGCPENIEESNKDIFCTIFLGLKKITCTWNRSPWWNLIWNQIYKYFFRLFLCILFSFNVMFIFMYLETNALPGSF